MACVSSSNLIRAASSTASIQRESSSSPLTTAAASTHQAVQTTILPGVPMPEVHIARGPLPIPASNHYIVTPATPATPKLTIRTSPSPSPSISPSTSINHFDDIRERQNPNGEIYVGSYKDGKYHGKGRLTLPNGDVYDGQFEDGEYQGRGKLTCSNRDIVYDGSFEHGMFNGNGTLTCYSKNQVYIGQFLNGMFSGSGKIFIGEEISYDGQFKDDLFNGHGMRILPNKDIYRGSFIDGEFDGKGSITLPNGNVYEGIFRKGKMLTENVKITFHTRDLYGIVYQGPIENYMPNGSGMQTNPDKSFFKGNFKDGKAHGLITLYHPDGSYHTEMECRNGERVESTCCIIQ